VQARPPFFFNTVADGLAFIMKTHLPADVTIQHYLDDLLILAPSQASAKEALTTFRLVATRLGVSIKESKTVGPAQRVTFLGLILDSVRMVVEAPPDKLKSLLVSLTEWRERSSCTRRELDTLVGSLSFIARAVRLARSFLRRMISCQFSPGGSRYVHLDEGFQKDVQWWLSFAERWNGVEAVAAPLQADAGDLQLFTDSSGFQVAGVFGHRWFPLPIEEAAGRGASISTEHYISAKERFALVVASFTWGNLLSGLEITFRLDNAAVVTAVNKHTSRDAP